MSVLEDIIYELAEKKSDIGTKVADKSEDIIEIQYIRIIGVLRFTDFYIAYRG